MHFYLSNKYLHEIRYSTNINIEKEQLLLVLHYVVFTVVAQKNVLLTRATSEKKNSCVFYNIIYMTLTHHSFICSCSSFVCWKTNLCNKPTFLTTLLCIFPMEQEELYKTLQIKINALNGTMTSLNDVSIEKVHIAISCVISKLN